MLDIFFSDGLLKKPIIYSPAVGFFMMFPEQNVNEKH